MHLPIEIFLGIGKYCNYAKYHLPVEVVGEFVGGVIFPSGLSDRADSTNFLECFDEEPYCLMGCEVLQILKESLDKLWGTSDKESEHGIASDVSGIVSGVFDLSGNSWDVSDEITVGLLDGVGETGWIETVELGSGNDRWDLSRGISGSGNFLIKVVEGDSFVIKKQLVEGEEVMFLNEVAILKCFWLCGCIIFFLNFGTTLLPKLFETFSFMMYLCFVPAFNFIFSVKTFFLIPKTPKIKFYIY